jgi:hypothetical protein
VPLLLGSTDVTHIAIKAAGLGLLLLSATTLAADTQTVMSSKEVKWGPAAPVLPKGAMMTVMAGNPGGTGLVALRLKMPAG